MDFVIKSREYIAQRLLEAEAFEEDAEALLKMVQRIHDNMALLEEFCQLIEARSAPAPQPQKQKRPFKRRPHAQKYGFLDMKPYDEIFVPGVRSRKINGSLNHAKRTMGGKFQVRSMSRNGVAGMLVVRTA